MKTKIILSLVYLILSFVPSAVQAEKLLKFDVVQLCNQPLDRPLSTYTNDGRFTLTGAGRDGSDCCFEGAFAGVSTDASNFTFICRVAKRPTGTSDPQYGVMLRAGISGPENQINFRYDGRPGKGCWRWLMKYHVTPSSHDGSGRSYLYDYDESVTAADGIWLKVVRRYPYTYLYYSMDGENWTEFGADYRKVMLAQKVWVGPQLTAGADGKTAATMTFDNLSFTVDRDVDVVRATDVMKEYHPPIKPMVAYFAKVDPGDGRDPASAFIQMPRGMNPKNIRALIWSAGSKEMTVNGNDNLEWIKEAGLRRPADMKSWEGAYQMLNTRPFTQIWEHYGVVRLGGYFKPEFYPQAVESLARVTGIKHLPNIPFCVTGASFAGGMSARAANLYPDRCIASAPTLIGMAGADKADAEIFRIPHLHVIGSRDGGHLRDVESWIPKLHDQHALWAPTPMWRVYHRQHKSFGIIFPYFIETMNLRLPTKPDYTRGPPKLKQLDERSGWYGLTKTWETNYPEVVPIRSYKGGSRELVWLPNELTARIWQAFVSQNPKTIIQFPMFEGHNNYGLPNPHGWHNSTLAADEPFELLASGPVADDLKVEYYAGLKQLKVLKEHGNPLHVTLDGPGPGLHAIYAITKWNGNQEISRPVMIMFYKRK